MHIHFLKFEQNQIENDRNEEILSRAFACFKKPDPVCVFSHSAEEKCKSHFSFEWKSERENFPQSYALLPKEIS